MVTEKKKAPYNGITTEESRLKSEAIIKVNGVEVVAAEYFKDPKKYNSNPMDPKYVEECQKHLEESIRVKAKLQVDPSTLKTLL